MAVLMSHAGDRVLTRKAARRRERPKPGRIALPLAGDFGTRSIGDVTPKDAVRILRTAADGDPVEREALFEDMLKHDGHLFSVADSRRLALTGLPWEIIAASEANQVPTDKQAEADETTAFCRGIFSGIAELMPALSHMRDSVDRGLRIAEVEYERRDSQLVPVQLHPLLPNQYIQDPQVEGRIRIVTKENRQGFPLDEQPAGKFLVMHRYASGNNPFDAGLFLKALMWHMYTRWGMRWWADGLERFGVPFLIAEYLADAKAEEKDAILDILLKMGASGVGLVRAGTEIHMLESKRSGDLPHEKLAEFSDRQKSKIWLGATLTVDQGKVGSQALGREHGEVKKDRLEEDILQESAMMAQLIAPLVRLRFGEDAWVPCFRRILETVKDLGATATWLSTLMNSTGVRPTYGFVKDEFGIEFPKGTNLKAAVPGPSISGGIFSDRIPASESRAASGCCGDAELSPHRALDKIAGRRRTAVTRIMPWVFMAVFASRAQSQNVIDLIGQNIGRAGSLEAALSALPDTFDELPIDRFQELERQFLLASHLAGQDFARRRASLRRGLRANSEQVEYSAHAEIDFDDLPFDEAIETLRERLLLDPETFLDLDSQARSRAWRVAGIWNMRLLAMVHDSLVEAIEAGQTARDFRLSIPELAEKRGWLGENPWHSDLVHFQNMAMSHAAGRIRQYDEFGVGQWRFVANGESCPICEPEIGKVYKTTDTDRLPPLHFWCDCEDEPVFDEELQPGELRDSGSEANGALFESRSPRGGFKFDARQYGDLEPVSLGGFPPALRGALTAFGNRLGWRFVS